MVVAPGATDLAATLGTRAVRSLIQVTVPDRVLQGPIYRAAMARAEAG